MEYREYMTDETHSYLSELFRDELNNGYAYQYTSSWLAVNGLDNFSTFFKYRAREEFKHAEMIREFCQDKDILLNFGDPIKGFPMELNNISDFCKFAYELERKTSKRWEIFWDSCFAQGNSRLLIDLGEDFLSEQNEEEEWAHVLMDYAKNLGDDRGAWQRFDNGFDPESYGLGIGGDDDD